MTQNGYTKERTALLFVDPYIDFLSEGGKLWPLVKSVAREVGLLDHQSGLFQTVKDISVA